MSLFAYIFITLVLACISGFHLHRYLFITRLPPTQQHSAASSTSRNETKIENYERIIAEKVGADGRLNVLSDHEARAIANRNLAAGFGIDNAFTTQDRGYAREFVRRGSRSMGLSDARWKELSKTARADAESFVTASADDNVPLAKLVQIVSLGMAFRVFVTETDLPTGTDHGDRLTVAETINDIWIKSKQPGSQVDFAEEQLLHDALWALTPDHEILTPRENPLNWILPSFETLWRIALRTLVEVRFTSGRAHPEWCMVLREFAENPTKEQFNQPEHPDHMSVQAIVDEALRLYGWRHLHEEEADIEAIHVDEEIWGDDALEFVPTRWNNTSDLHRRALMPFGKKPFECPAKPVFGPRMIALIVGTLVAVFDGKGNWILECADEEVAEELRVGKRLRLDRESYTDVLLRRI